MTLGETASTFAEQLMIDAVLASPEAGAEERACMLDSRMQGRRGLPAQHPHALSLREGCVRGETAGGRTVRCRRLEAPDGGTRSASGTATHSPSDELDPWFWASKLHFYLTGISFYNFPYTFGYLFSLGLFARAQQEGSDFRGALRCPPEGDGQRQCRAGRASAASGSTSASPEFWHASIDGIEADPRSSSSRCVGDALSPLLDSPLD